MNTQVWDSESSIDHVIPTIIASIFAELPRRFLTADSADRERGSSEEIAESAQKYHRIKTNFPQVNVLLAAVVPAAICSALYSTS